MALKALNPHNPQHEQIAEKDSRDSEESKDDTSKGKKNAALAVGLVSLLVIPFVGYKCLKKSSDLQSFDAEQEKQVHEEEQFTQEDNQHTTDAPSSDNGSASMLNSDPNKKKHLLSELTKDYEDEDVTKSYSDIEQKEDLKQLKEGILKKKKMQFAFIEDVLVMLASKIKTIVDKSRSTKKLIGIDYNFKEALEVMREEKALKSFIEEAKKPVINNINKGSDKAKQSQVIIEDAMKLFKQFKGLADIQSAMTGINELYAKSSTNKSHLTGGILGLGGGKVEFYNDANKLNKETVQAVQAYFLGMKQICTTILHCLPEKYSSTLQSIITDIESFSHQLQDLPNEKPSK